MPYRDKTGPNGSGPGSGRGMGPCVGNTPGMYGRRGGMGFGNRGFGGRGSGRMGSGYESPQFQMSEQDYLSNEVDSLQKSLELMKKRLKEIEPETKK